MLERTFGPGRVLFLAFGKEFKVQLQRGESRTPRARLKSSPWGRRCYQKRDKEADLHFAKKPQRKQHGGTMMLSLETRNSLERRNVHSSVFLSTTVASSLNEATQVGSLPRSS